MLEFGVVEGVDGIDLRIAVWPGGPRRALLIGGYAEFIEKLETPARALLERGYTVHGFDWRGQGGSGRQLRDAGRRGHVARFEDHLADLAKVVAHWDVGFDLALAHSMGGHVLLRALAEARVAVPRAIVTAPMIDVLTRGWPRPLARWLARAARLTPLNGRFVPGGAGFDPAWRPFEGNPLTTDRASFDAFQAILRARPELAVGAPTYGWLAAAFDSIDALLAPGVAERVSIPVLVAMAEDERVVDNAAIPPFVARLPRGRLLHVPGARHEILAEAPAVRDRFWQAVDDFMREG